MHSFLVRATVAALLFQASADPVRAGHYTVVDVDGEGTTRLWGINAKGQVIGVWDESAFLRETDGTIVPVTVPDNVEPWPEGINSRGDIAGVASHGCGTLGFSCSMGFVRLADGTVTTFNASGDPLDNTNAVAINEADETVGYFTDSSYAGHGFIRQPDGTVTIVDVPGSSAVGLAALNNRGYAAGSFADGVGQHGLLVGPDGSQTIFDIPGAQDIGVAGLNDDGWITGYYDHDGYERTGFLRSPDGTITFIDVGGVSDTRVVSINRSGNVAGCYVPAKRVRGFVQTLSGETRILKIKGVHDVEPAGINDRGFVAGTYAVKDGEISKTYGFIWRP